MNTECDLIWGDDHESEVFAQVREDKLCIIFRFFENPHHPQSLPSRIVTHFHELEANDASESFPDRASMREAIFALVRSVWDQCIQYPSIGAPDVTVEIYEDVREQIQWRISHDSLYDVYVASLTPLSHLFQDETSGLQPYDTVDYSSLVQLWHPDSGRGRTVVVRSCSTLYVFKGVDFGAFLESQAEFKHLVDDCYHEIRTISSLPPHPNIVPPPKILVTVKMVNDEGPAFVCGALYPFMENGTLEDQIKKSQATGVQKPLSSRAKWCFQMVYAIAHTHMKAHTYHMDIKPANFLLDAHEDLILIDWEQSGAPLCTLAPEADGSWDVHSVPASPNGNVAATHGPELSYIKYDGPERINLAWSRPKWNVFPLWRDHYPEALMAAEVFSLGRTMWMLFEQLTQMEVEENEPITVSWTDASSDIPEDWKRIVDSCLEPDPTKRIRLSSLLVKWQHILEAT
ncbi:MAG: hypothetical protein Q9222_001902 [Ikaeria aurantiellina]